MCPLGAVVIRDVKQSATLRTIRPLLRRENSTNIHSEIALCSHTMLLITHGEAKVSSDLTPRSNQRTIVITFIGGNQDHRTGLLSYVERSQNTDRDPYSRQKRD